MNPVELKGIFLAAFVCGVIAVGLWLLISTTERPRYLRWLKGWPMILSYLGILFFVLGISTALMSPEDFKYVRFAWLLGGVVSMRLLTKV